MKCERKTPVRCFFLLSISAAVLFSCGGDANEAQKGSVSDSIPETSEQPSGMFDTTAIQQEEYQIAFDTISEKNSVHHYDVSAIYPQITGLQNPKIEEGFNKGVRDSVMAMVRDFTSFLQTEGGFDDPESSSTFELRTIIHAKNERGLSLELSIYTYSAGAAHPNSSTFSINYDLRTGQFISLGDLFLPDAEYLEMIADFCIQELVARQVSDDEWIKRGAEQLAENYRTFFVTPEALVIQFDPYIVAPYAAGPQTVEIPWSQLKEMIDPKSMAGR